MRNPIYRCSKFVPVQRSWKILHPDDRCHRGRETAPGRDATRAGDVCGYVHVVSNGAYATGSEKSALYSSGEAPDGKINGRDEVCRGGIYAGESGHARVEPGSPCQLRCDDRADLGEERDFDLAASKPSIAPGRRYNPRLARARRHPLHHDTRERQRASAIHWQLQHERPTEPPRDVSSQSLQPGLRRAR